MNDVLAALTARSDPLPLATMAGTAALALLCIGWAPAWRATRQVVTIAHEAAHAVVARLCGRELTAIRLHSDTSGLTVSRGKPTGFGMIATLVAGYPGPSLVGLLAAYVLSVGYAAALLWSFVLALVLILVKIRNWYGLWSVLVCGVIVGAVTWWGAPQVQSGFAHVVAWFLLLAAPRAVLELQQARRRGDGRTSDADQLARLTVLPGAGWVLVFALITLGSLAAGALILLGDLGVLSGGA